MIEQKMAPASDRFVRLKADLHDQLVQSMDLEVASSLDQDALRREITCRANELCTRNGSLLSKSERTILVTELVDDILGLGPLEPLLRDPQVSDILINGPNCIFVERNGRMQATDIRFRDNEHLVRTVQRIAANVGRRIDESSPMVDARLADGSRVNAVIGPLALDGALVSIRRFGDTQIKPGDLIDKQSASVEMIAFLQACVIARMNIIVSGGTGSGKTTLLNVLSGFIPEDERVVTIEDAAELQLQQPHVARMETRPANLEGEGKIDARDLLVNSLRMRPDRIIVGECRGVEAFDMLQALNTGHDGGMSTIHANDTREAMNRLELLVSLAVADLSMESISRQIASAVDIIVQTKRVDGGKRKITKISEITGCTDGKIDMHDVFEFHQVGVSETGDAMGELRATGVRPKCFEKLKAKGLDLSVECFERGNRVKDQFESLGFERGVKKC